MATLKDFDTLAEAKLHTDTERNFLTANEVSTLLFMNNLYFYFMKATDEIKTFISDVITRGGDFDLMDNTEDGIVNGYLLQGLVDAESDETIKANLVNLQAGLLGEANKEVYPFANATQLQFNIANKIYTEKKASNYTRGKYVKVTLIDALPFDCSASTHSKKEGRNYANLYTPIHFRQDDTYKEYEFTLSKNIDGDLYIRLPIENFNYAVEVL